MIVIDERALLLAFGTVMSYVCIITAKTRFNFVLGWLALLHAAWWVMGYAVDRVQ